MLLRINFPMQILKSYFYSHCVKDDAWKLPFHLITINYHFWQIFRESFSWTNNSLHRAQMKSHTASVFVAFEGRYFRKTLSSTLMEKFVPKKQRVLLFTWFSQIYWKPLSDLRVEFFLTFELVKFFIWLNLAQNFLNWRSTRCRIWLE